MSLPSDINPQLLALSSGYNLTRSLRFRSSASAYLNRTPASATNRQKFTISVWYKAGGISAGFVNANILNAGGDGSSVLISGTGAFGPTYIDRLLYREGGATLLYWPMVFRDPASWYHIVFAMDTTQATAANRTKLYVNGVDQGAFSGTAITQNASTSINNTSAHYINTYNGTAYPSDLYYTEYNFVDGQQLTPSSFGSTNATTGVWQPARYTGTYGTNGFYLPFTDNSALTTASNVGLGKDFSGNANYWVTNNISITAGVTYDSMTDVPTLTSATAANFAVLNPLDYSNGAPINGNLALSNSSTRQYYGARATFGLSSGKWYWEQTIVTNTTGAALIAGGVCLSTYTLSSGIGSAGFWGFQNTDGSTNSWKYDNGTGTNTFTIFGVNDIAGFALDMGAGTLDVYRNNTLQFTCSTSLAGKTVFPVGQIYASLGQSASCAINFGQRPFSYTPPTGFVALNTYNLPTSTIVKGNTVMDATLYTGTGATQSITNAASFKPDFVWLKSRSATTNHQIFDSVRGTTKVLVSNSTEAETTSANTITSFNSGGFTVGTNTAINTNAATYVGWQWQAGQGSTSSDTNGTITSTVSVNASAGFSIATFTGTGAAGTVGHGLGVAPSMYIVKSRSAVGDWWVYHTSLGAGKTIWLSLTDAAATGGYWSNTAPTSSVFSIATGGGLNVNGVTQVAYCWTPIAGFSAFGSYTGNGSDNGPFVYTGFRPKFVMIKRTDSTSDWYIWDTARDTYNVVTNTLLADTSGAETSATSIDDLSNGFKCRSATVVNASGGTYIYATFAENPFKNALAR